MITLTSINRSLELVLGGAVAANQLDIVVNFIDLRATGTLQGFGSKVSNSNSTTTVTICDAPSSGVTRVIRSISIYNKDTATVTITIKYDDNATEYTIFKVTLLTLEQAYYEDSTGWQVLSSAG